MTPIYFPFTYISEPLLDELLNYFGRIAVYQSSRNHIPENMTAMAKSGKIDIRTPVEGDEERFKKILQDFKAWADLHQRSEMSLLKTQAGKIPFFNENATSQIKSDIMRRDPEKPSQEKSERLLRARLFLQVAQEHDLQHDALRLDLLSFEAMEQHMIKELHGEILSSSPDIDTYQSVASEDLGQYMAKERIDAWTHIMLHDHRQSGLFITHSRAVIEHLLDAAPEAKKLSDIDATGAFENGSEPKENRLLHQLETIVADAASAATTAATAPPLFNEKDRKRALIFYIIPGLSPHQFFSRYMEAAARVSQNKRSMEPAQNTLIGWYDR